MRTTVENVPSRKRVLIVALGVLAVVARVDAGSRTPFEPVRRDAKIQVVGPGTIFGVRVGFVAANLIIPRATTKELAEYARDAGAPAAARWLCTAYAVAPTFQPDAASLRQLVAAAAAHADGGPDAADALVCPRVRDNLREVRTRFEPRGCLFTGGCHTVRYTVISNDLAYRACTATDAEREAYDADRCLTVFLGRTGRASALKIFARRAAHRNRCLQVSLSAGFTPSVQLFTSRADNCPVVAPIGARLDRHAGKRWPGESSLR